MKPLGLESSTLPLSHCAPMFLGTFVANNMDPDQTGPKGSKVYGFSYDGAVVMTHNIIIIGFLNNMQVTSSTSVPKLDIWDWQTKWRCR